MSKSFYKANILILTIILGIGISLQARNLDKIYEYVPLRVIHDYKSAVEKEKVEIANIKGLIESYKNKIKEYEDGEIREEDFVKLLRRQVKELKIVSGFSDVQGPGIIIIIDDGKRELYEGEDPNNVLVHDIDILNIINDLRVAGAEAISINGQRVLSNTEINCSGVTIKINNQEFAQPFIIKAIGEPKVLEASIKAPGTYGNLLKEVGLFIEVNTSVNINVPKYSEEINYKFLQVKEGD